MLYKQINNLTKTNAVFSSIRHSFLLLVLIALCQSCTNRKEIETIESSTTDVAYQISLNKSGKIILDEILENIKYIPLKKYDGKILGAVDKLISSNGEIIILDKTHSKCVFVFDSLGNNKLIIDSFGNAPGEFSTMLDVSVDEARNEILILDDSRTEIYRYSKLNGEYIGKYNEMGRFYVDEFIYFENNFFFNTGNACETFCNSLIKYDLQSKTTSGYLDIPEDQQNKNYSGLNLLTKAPDGVLLSQTFNNTVYKYDGKDIYPYISFDAGAYNITDRSIFTRFKSNLVRFTQEINKYFQGPRLILETSDMIYMESNMDYAKNWMFYNKGQSSTHSANSLSLSSNLKNLSFRAPKGILFDQLTGVLDSDELQAIKKSLEANNISRDLLDEDFMEILSGITDESNPLLMLYRFK